MSFLTWNPDDCCALLPPEASVRTQIVGVSPTWISENLHDAIRGTTIPHAWLRVKLDDAFLLDVMEELAYFQVP